MPAGIGWTDERVALLKKLWGEGLSCSQIAKRIDASVTRCAVIGKIHRLGLSGRTCHRDPKPKRPKTQRSVWFKPVSRVPIPTEPLPPPHETDIARVAFVDLQDTHCKFVCGEPKGPYEKQFCGQPRHKGLPYCEVHSQRCFQVPVPRNYLPAAIRGPKLGTSRLDALKEFEDAH